MDQPGMAAVSRPHGYVFEVPLVGAAEPEPLRAMGRFVHEAAAIDPATGIVYETEDRTLAGCYRFTPNRRGLLTLVFESPNAAVARNLDNVTVSPRGGLVVCEDGGGQPQRVHGLTRDGQIFPFAQNNVMLDGQKNGFRGDFRTREFAGAVFSPDGDWLFVNAQTPGITFAITGDWAGTEI